MKAILKNLSVLALLAAISGLLTSCYDNDDPTDESIFLGETVERDSLDLWLLKNYTYPYNVQFKYKMEDIESDMSYHLVPADSAKAAKLAIIVKYLWFDAYTEVTGADFVKENVPRVIHLIGCPAYNSNGTIVLGTAEGGLKVTLYMVNYLTDAMLHNYATLNTYYFHTIHHEFTHILNQKKPYDTNFDLITEDAYVSGDWYLQSTSTALSSGFVTPYAMSEPGEDFAEMMSEYITMSEEDWDALLTSAGTTGADLINQKLAIVRSYMQSSWNIDIDDMREAIMHRADEISTLDLEHLK